MTPEEIRVLAFAKTHILNCLAGLRLCLAQSGEDRLQIVYQAQIDILRDALIALSKEEDRDAIPE